MAVSWASKFIPFLPGGQRPEVAVPFAQRAGGLTARDASPAEIKALSEATAGHDDLDTLDLVPGNTSFSQKILNMIRQGDPARAITLLQKAFDRVETLPQLDHVTTIAHKAVEAMDAKGYDAEAHQMARILFATSHIRNDLQHAPKLAIA